VHNTTFAYIYIFNACNFAILGIFQSCKRPCGEGRRLNAKLAWLLTSGGRRPGHVVVDILEPDGIVGGEGGQGQDPDSPEETIVIIGAGDSDLLTRKC
jgi:hypothetical protein